MYNNFLKNINNFIRNNYFNKITNFDNNKLFKFEYFLYIKFYIINFFLNNLKNNNFINYLLLLNFQYIIGELSLKNIKYYKIKTNNNVEFLNKVSIYILNFLIFNEIYFNKKIKIFNKIIKINNLFLFQLGIIIHKLFKKRIYYIKHKKTLIDNFDFLFLLHGLEDLNNVIEKTKFMNYPNMYIFINFLLFMFYN